MERPRYYHPFGALTTMWSSRTHIDSYKGAVAASQQEYFEGHTPPKTVSNFSAAAYILGKDRLPKRIPSSKIHNVGYLISMLAEGRRSSVPSERYRCGEALQELRDGNVAKAQDIYLGMAFRSIQLLEAFGRDGYMSHQAHQEIEAKHDLRIANRIFRRTGLLPKHQLRKLERFSKNSAAKST